MLQILLLLVSGVLSKDWRVNYPDQICAARGSSVTIHCTFTYPSGQQVKEVKWCSMNSNSDVCLTGQYVYDSENNNIQSNFQYIGDKSSNCSLLIRNIKLSDSGEYKFRFITHSPEGKWTNRSGVNISVHDLRVSMSSSRENERIIVGDSVNLTCSLNCSAGLADVQWFKNGKPMDQSNPVLIFTNVTAGDCGGYSCSLRNINTLSEELKFYFEGLQCVHSRSLIVSIVVPSLVTLFFISAFVMFKRRGKTKTQRQPMEGVETLATHENIYQTTAETQASSDTNQQEAANKPQEDEVQYASVNVKTKKTLLKPVDFVQSEDSTIYSGVMNG